MGLKKSGILQIISKLLKKGFDMKYFLIYLYRGLVVDVSSFDDEDSQKNQFFHDANLPDYMQHMRYDSIQIFNQVT